MQIQFMGGARTVTGSQHLVSANGHKILLECGLFQGARRESYEKNLNFAYDPADVDVVILSHAHIDHSGNIPNLVKKGFKGRVFATRPTVDLSDIMLRDSAYLQEKDVEFVNKIKKAKHEPPVEPLYTIEDAERALGVFTGVAYNTPVSVVDGVDVTFRDAGHILGSSGVVLEIKKKGQVTRLGFSGDIGRFDVPILRDPEPLDDLDALIMESTYGNRMHEKTEDVEKELADIIKGVVKEGGKIIIPAFAVGRTQMLVYRLHLMLEKGQIPRIPVFVDSPMACSATDVFRQHTDCFDEEALYHFTNDKEDPFTGQGFACIRDVAASKQLNRLTEPHIIISASGMAEGGRILHHLKNNIGEKRNLVLLVGFAAQHTLARRIMDGEKRVRIFGEEYQVKCGVKTMLYFSAHADRRGLLDYLDPSPPDKLKNIFLVHGEEEPAMDLRNAIRSKGYQNVHVPAPGDTFKL